jgi:choline dehydrogenase
LCPTPQNKILLVPTSTILFCAVLQTLARRIFGWEAATMAFVHPSRSFLVALAITLLSFFGPAFGQNTNENATYDYIVVGSGPGGGIVASNLALAGHTVLLLEAGQDASEDLSTTVNALYFPQSLDLQWHFFVKHHTDDAVEERYRLLTWTLPDGTFWIGPKAQAPEGAVLNGVW